MTTFRIVIEMDNVAKGDATTLAQEIWDENAEDMDADLGEFRMQVQRGNEHAVGSWFDTDWVPDSE
jgi:hypothetical protein